MNITRREFSRAAVLTLAAAACSRVLGPGFDLIGAAQAQTPSQADLMKPTALEDMAMGAANAPVTIIGYLSTTCPHCAHFETTTFPELKKRYIDTGKVRFIYREFALNPLDAGAVMLLRCAPKDRYFPLLEVLFQKQDQWVVQQPIPPLLAIAKQAGFTEDSFNKCLSNQKMLDDIDSARNYASEKLGVNSTPTFFINGKIYRGDMKIEEMEKEILPYLKAS
ncbi:MAG: DsbA family protein [Pseudorhodoplanes sp.]